MDSQEKLIPRMGTILKLLSATSPFFWKTFSREYKHKNSNADYCVVGEGEKTFLEIINNFTNNMPIAGLFG